MAYRNKTYVAFDADTDMDYYKTMKMWKANDNLDFDFHNAHELNNLRSTSSEATIKAKLKERLKNTKLMIVLVGEHTKDLYKFVRWEMDVALDMNIPISVVNLNDKKNQDTKKCPPIIKDKLVLHIPFKLKPIKWAIDNWPNRIEYWAKQNKISPKILTAETYKEMGID